MPELLIATHNRGKVREIAALLAGTRWTLTGLPEDLAEFEETGETFAENSRGKALHYAGALGLPALADDSGLEIDALDGEPGVRSARYIDPNIPQSRRNLLVLKRLVDVADVERTARFVCHLTLADEGRIVHEVTGRCEGRITRSARGAAGFGYDPIFVVEGEDESRTFGEMLQKEKARYSHRGRAVRAMAEFLATWDPAAARGT